MLVCWIEERNPFDRNVDQLNRNIETEKAAGKDVNVGRCQEIGSSIISSLSRNDATTISFEKNKAVTNKAMKSDDETVLVDLQLLFQRITIVAQDT